MAVSKRDGRRHGGHRRTRECWSLRGSVAGTNGCKLGRWCKTYTHRVERRLGKLDTYAQFVEAYVGDAGQESYSVR